MRRFLWRLGRIFDVAKLITAIAGTALTTWFAWNEQIRPAVITGAITMVAWMAIGRAIRTGSFLQPW